MEGVAWTLIGLLGAAMAALVGGIFHVGSRIDVLGSRIDALGSRIDALAATMSQHIAHHTG